MSKVIVITSGKGGVGKTTSTANIGAGLARMNKKVVLVDTDIGLRNLDVVMGLENRISRYFSPEEMLPAAGQGILAVQAREGECRAAAQLLDDAETRVCALAERAFIRALGGGCFSPAAAYAVLENGMLRLRGLYVSADERSLIRGELTGAPETGERLGCMLAERLRRQAEEET